MNTTIELYGIEFECEFDYQPFEPAERGPEAQYAGCCESVDGVNKMMHKGTDFCDILFSDNEVFVKTLILDSLRED